MTVNRSDHWSGCTVLRIHTYSFTRWLQAPTSIMINWSVERMTITDLSRCVNRMSDEMKFFPNVRHGFRKWLQLWLEEIIETVISSIAHVCRQIHSSMHDPRLNGLNRKKKNDNPKTVDNKNNIYIDSGWI